MSKIEWTDVTWNPFTGCTNVSPGCDNCYMHAMYPRLNSMGVKGYEKDGETVQVFEERFAQPSRWRMPRRIFVNSMSDTFHPHVPAPSLITLMSVMKWHVRHTFQVLTKRPGRAVAWNLGASALYRDKRFEWLWPSNIHLGTSVETQKYAPRIEVLARVPVPVKFVSAEPLLGELDLTKYMDAGQIQWLIVGGESGPRARPMDLDWARDLRDQAVLRGIPFFLKQLGGRGDKRGGDKAVLDGRTWQEFPSELPGR